VRGDLGLCTNLAAEQMELAGRQSDPGIMMEALFAHGFTRFFRADFAAAHHACTKALDECEDLEQTKLWAALISHNSSIGHRCIRALSLWHLGYPDQALKAIREMIELARSIGQPFGLCVALFHAAWLHREYRIAAEA
jgi:hypothetical protein